MGKISDMEKTQLTEMLEMFETIRNERRTAANTAERIGNAFLAILPYLGNHLSKDCPETLQYLLTAPPSIVSKIGRASCRERV